MVFYAMDSLWEKLPSPVASHDIPRNVSCASGFAPFDGKTGGYSTVPNKISTKLIRDDTSSLT